MKYGGKTGECGGQRSGPGPRINGVRGKAQLDRIFTDPADPRTKAYVTGRMG